MDRVQAFRGMIRLSGLGNCPRPLGYRVLEVGPDPEFKEETEENPRFIDGHYHEWDIKRRMVKDGVKFYAGLGESVRVKLNLYRDMVVTMGSRKIDGIINVPDTVAKYPHGDFIAEMKSMASGYFWKFVKGGYRVGFPSYFAQIQGELNAEFGSYEPLEESDTPFVAMYKEFQKNSEPLPLVLPEKALIVAKNKETGKLWYEQIEKDEAYFVGLSRRWRDAEDAIAHEELPDRLHEDADNYECAQCPWKSRCWVEVAVGKPTASALSLWGEDAAPAAEAYAIGKKFVELGEQIMEGPKELLSMVSPGSVRVGPVKVTAFNTNRTIWNHKRLEEILTPAQLDEVRITKQSLYTRRDVDKLTGDEIMDLIKKVKSGTVSLLMEGNQ